MNRIFRFERGLTLIEMLVTLTLLAILSLLTWQALDTTERVTTRTQHQHHDTLRILSVLDQLEQDVSQHALLESPYPSVAGQVTSPDAPVLPRSIQWQDNRLSIMRLSADGRLQPITWQVRQHGLQRELLQRNPQTHHSLSMRLDAVTSFRMRVWIPQRGWMPLREVPAGLQATGLEFLIDTQHRGQTINYRKVVMLP